MSILSTLKISIDSLKTNKLRSFLTMLGVIIGVASVILLVSLGAGLEKFITQQFADLGTDLLLITPGTPSFEEGAGREGGPPGASSNKLTTEISELVGKRASLVSATTPIAVRQAEIRFLGNTHSTGILGTTANYSVIRRSPVSTGRFLAQRDISSSSRVAVLGKTAKEELFGRRKAAGKEVKIAGKTFTVIGILEEKGSAFGNDQDDLIIIPVSTFRQTFDLDKVSYIYAKVKNIETVPSAKRQVESIVSNRLEEEDFAVIDPQEFLSTVTSILGLLTTALAGIAAISLIVGGIGIANIMLVSVTERIREIGLRKTVGATRKDILMQFLTEAAVLSILGGGIGILLGTGGALLLDRFAAAAIPLWSIALGFGVSALTGIISGVGPAIKAARMNPIQALRYE